MVTIDELIKEIEELKKYKSKYESTQKDKQVMSDMLYDYMVREYEAKSIDQRKSEYISKWCKDCFDGCYECEYRNNLPDDILKPIKSDDAWIPKHVRCSYFRWS